MSDSIELLIDLFALSLCSWGIFCLFTAFSIQRFIVKRYEQETDLLDTDFFKNHVPFAQYLPNFFSSEIYVGHLMMCLWGWRYFRTKKIYKDIKESTLVTRHFTKEEKNKVKRYAISLLILISHGIVYIIFKSIWPEVFD